MTAPSWVSAVLDLAVREHDEAVAFWAGVTGYAVSEPRGGADEVCSLTPPDGDEHLLAQRVAAGPSRIHLDLHVVDPRAAADVALERGATEVHASDHGHVVLTSPGGLRFCLVTHPASVPAPPATWPGGRSVVDQVCLDVAPTAYDAERRFWADTLGRTLASSSISPEFESLAPPPGQRLRILLQRLDADQPSTTAHLDLACDDRPVETARHLDLGARVVAEHPHWTVLAGPTGTAYCLTDREPA